MAGGQQILDERCVRRKRVRNVFVPTALVLMFVLDYTSIRHKSAIYDEGDHFLYGYAVLSGRSDRNFDSKMPVSALNALPFRLSMELAPAWLRSPLAKRNTARAVTILFTALMGLVIYAWSSSLYGEWAARLSLALYTLSPTIHGHARWITTDAFVAGTVALALFLYWRTLTGTGRRRLWFGIAASLALGACQLTKASAVWLYPIFGIVLLLHWGPEAIRRWRHGERRGLARELGRGAGWSLAFVGSSLMVVNAGFLFNGTGTPLSDYSFRSRLFQQLQSDRNPLRTLPLPLPRPFVEGLDWIKRNEVTGRGRGAAYLLGQTRRGGVRFDDYYLVLFLFKTPLAVHLLIVAAVAHRLRHRERYAFWRNEVFLVVPILFYFVYFNYFCHAQIGIRLLLVIYPLLHVFCGGLLMDLSTLRIQSRIAVAALVAYLAVSSLSYYPHYLSYTNELIGRATAYRLFADSNLDWGQNHWYLRRYATAHAGLQIDPERPVAGRVAISINRLTGVADGCEWCPWLQRNFEPVDHVAYSYLVYDIPLDAIRESAHSGSAAKMPE